jgi:hypothetical protein
MLMPTENCAAAIAGIAANAPTIRTLERNGRLQVFIQTPVAQSCVILNAPHQFLVTQCTTLPRPLNIYSCAHPQHC